MPRPPVGLPLLLCLLILLPCPAGGAALAPAGAPELLIAAASDLVFAFREIASAFQRERGVAVRVDSRTTASSGDAGTPAKLFSSPP